MGKVRRVDYVPDEYITGVGGVLRADEQGVYWMICSLIMSEGGPIEYNARRLANLCLIRPAEVRRITEILIEKHKLSVTDDGRLSQKRAQNEVEMASKRIQIATENGAKGGRPRKIIEQNQQNTKPDGYFPAKLSLTTNTKDEEDSVRTESLKSTKPAKRRHSYSDRFSEFWTAYPTDALMSKAAAGKAFEGLTVEDQDAAIASIPAFKAYCSQHVDYRPVHAVRYISQGRFEGFNKAAKQVDARVFVATGTPTWDALCRKRNVETLMHKEHHGQRGWWFDRMEIQQALARETA